MVRNLSSLQTYQLKDMIERAPVYQKSSSYQKQVISTMNFKIVPITKTNLSPTNRFYPLQQQSQHTDYRKYAYQTPPVLNSTANTNSSYNKRKNSIITIESVTTNLKKPDTSDASKFNIQRMIKLSRRSKPVFTPVKQNSIASKDAKPPIPSPRGSVSPRTPSTSPPPPLSVTVKLSKPKTDSDSTNPSSNITNKPQTEIRSRPVSRNSSVSYSPALPPPPRLG